MSGNNDGWSYNRFDKYEAELKGEKPAEEEAATEEVLEEGYKKMQKGGEVKGMHREADTGKVVDKAEVGKTYYPNMEKKKTSVAKRKEEEAGKLKEQLEATGIFTAEEIEALVESNCGDRAYPKGMQKGGRVGYQKGGKVECEKCEGKGCEHCDEKGSHKKEEVKEGAKPDFLDFDKDGNKEEPMKKALKEKGGKKKDAVVEAAVAALAPLLGKAMAAGKGALAAKGGMVAAAKGAAKTAVADAAMDLGGKGVRAVTSLPGKVMDAGKATVKTDEVETAE